MNSINLEGLEKRLKDGETIKFISKHDFCDVALRKSISGAMMFAVTLNTKLVSLSLGIKPCLKKLEHLMSERNIVENVDR